MRRLCLVLVGLHRCRIGPQELNHRESRLPRATRVPKVRRLCWGVVAFAGDDRGRRRQRCHLRRQYRPDGVATVWIPAWPICRAVSWKLRWSCGQRRTSARGYRFSPELCLSEFIELNHLTPSPTFSPHSRRDVHLTLVSTEPSGWRHLLLKTTCAERCYSS